MLVLELQILLLFFPLCAPHPEIATLCLALELPI
jgi:hypothetical protein